MAKKFLVEKTVEFSAAHQLHHIFGPCSRLHGHNFKLSVVLEASYLDHLGFAFDFYDLEKIVGERILKVLDHQDLNALPMFQDRPTTCEHIALWIFEEIERHLPSDSVKIARVVLAENSNSRITIENT